MLHNFPPCKHRNLLPNSGSARGLIIQFFVPSVRGTVTQPSVSPHTRKSVPPGLRKKERESCSSKTQICFRSIPLTRKRKKRCHPAYSLSVLSILGTRTARGGEKKVLRKKSGGCMYLSFSLLRTHTHVFVKSRDAQKGDCRRFLSRRKKEKKIIERIEKAQMQDDGGFALSISRETHLVKIPLNHVRFFSAPSVCANVVDA